MDSTSISIGHPTITPIFEPRISRWESRPRHFPSAVLCRRCFVHCLNSITQRPCQRPISDILASDWVVDLSLYFVGCASPWPGSITRHGVFDPFRSWLTVESRVQRPPSPRTARIGSHITWGRVKKGIRHWALTTNLEVSAIQITICSMCDALGERTPLSFHAMIIEFVSLEGPLRPWEADCCGEGLRNE